MAPGRYISCGFSLGNIAAKRCVKRTQSMTCRSNNSNKEICSARFQTDTKSAGRRSVKKIRSHVFYAKKPSSQKSSGCSTERSVAKTQRSNSSCSNQSRIKSSSWKRSDKRGSFVKPWRKKSPNWITLPHVKTTFNSPGQPNSSECRPGTLYSDVVFRGKIALPDPPAILFKKEKLNFCKDLLSDKYAKVEFAENLKASNTKINELKESLNKNEVDEAFPPLLASNLPAPKNSNKYKNNTKIKSAKPINCDLKTDELLFNVNSSNENNDMGIKTNIETEDLKPLEKEDSLAKYDHNELIKASNSEEVEDLNYSKNFCHRSEASINKIAYGLYLKSQYRQNSEKILHFLNFPTEHIKRSEAEDEWKHKYLPILNVKLFDNFDDECGFGYSGFNLSRQTFLNFEGGDQTFPRFSKHFNDDLYLGLENRAIVSLESALRNSSI